MAVLIPDGFTTSALMVVRSIGQKGVPVHVFSHVKNVPTIYSKYLYRWYFLPKSSERDLRVVGRAIMALLKKEDIAVIIPTADACTLFLSLHKHKFNAKIPISDYFILLKTFDRVESLKLAEELNIPHPEYYTINNIDEISRIRVKFPVVLKTRLSCYLEKGYYLVELPFRVKIATNKSELIKYLKVYEKRGLPLPIIEEYIPGNGYGFFGLFNHGEIRAIFCHRRLHENPYTGGTSSLRESFYDKKLVEYGKTLLETIGFHGVAMVEFRKDLRDSKYKLMEINGRFWGSLNLTLAAGVDMPYMLYKMAVEGDISPCFSYKIGVRARNMPLDLRYLSSVFKGSKYDFEQKRPNPLKEAYNFLKFYEPGLKYDFLWLDDPNPAACVLYNELFRWFL